MTYFYLVPWFLTDCTEMSNKGSIFFCLNFCCIITPICGIADHFCIIENFKKISGKNKNKLRTMYPKNPENFKNSKSRVQIYRFLSKRKVIFLVLVNASCKLFLSWIRDYLYVAMHLGNRYGSLTMIAL